MSSSESRNQRTTFDVHGSTQRSNPQKGFFHRLIHGENVLNLRPKFRVRHPILWGLGVIAVVFSGIVIIRQFYTRAAVSDFYPSVCLGSWQSPSNAAGEPETVATPGVAFTGNNSAIFVASGTQIFCGGFLPADFSSSGTITNISVNFAWQVGDAPTSTQSVAPESAPAGADTIDQSTSTPSSTIDTTSTDIVPVVAPPSSDATPPADTSSDSVAPPADTSTPLPPPPAPDQTDPSSQPASFAPWQPMISLLLPTALADDSTTVVTTDATSSATTTSADSTTTVIAAPAPDENFLQVSYSVDGTNWIPVQKVSEADWQNFTVTLPITAWSDLQKLQIRVDGIPTSLDVVPPVYLDGMSLEVHYDIPPLFGGDGGTVQNPATAPSSQDLQTPVVNTSPSDFAPVNGKSNFSAQEAPTFNFDLNSLPAPTSTDQTSTSSPQSFNDHATDGWRAFFYSTLGLGAIWPTAMAQSVVAPPVPTPGNPVVAEIDDPTGQPTDFQPVISTVNNQLSIAIPEPAGSFRPGRYHLKLWILRNGVIYASENDFTWGVLVVNFDKTIYDIGDMAHIGFGVLDDRGETVCGATLNATITRPDGTTASFSTSDGTIQKSSKCGPGTVTENPDYYASMMIGQAGTYQVSVTAITANGTRTITDQFQAQQTPLFDVRRSAPTRIYPPASYKNSIIIVANANYAGPIVETVPASFVVDGDFSSIAGSGAEQALTWNEHLKKGDSVTLHYSFKAPDVSPELYKIGPLQIGTWQEARQWQIAADAISPIQLVFIATASTTWVVPADWNSASNTIEVIGGGGNGVGISGGTGAGGGGGGYSESVNQTLTPGATVGIKIGGVASDTYVCNATSNCASIAGTAVIAGAKGGTSAVTTTAGSGGATSTAVALGTGSVKRSGGNGASGGGGGGAASPSGNGGNASGATGGTSGSGVAGGSGGNSCNNGTNGTEWSTTPAYGAGSGGGGKTGGSGGTGCAGGTYGAAGGTGNKNTTAQGGQQGIIVITYTPTTITLGDGTQNSPVTIGPGGATTTDDVFNFVTNNGTSTISNVTVSISTSTGLSKVLITDSAGTTIYGSSTNPATTTLNVTTTNMSVSTSTGTFNVRIVPLSATNMPAAPGGTYTVTSTITAWTDSKNLDQTGAQATTSIVTIDNQSPADVTSASGTAGNANVVLSWTNPGDTDFAKTLVIRSTGTSVVSSPTEGVSYSVGQSVGTSTVVCVVASSTSGCTDSSVANGTAYYYEIFSTDNYFNYALGVTPSGQPFTPSVVLPVVSNVHLNGDNAINLIPNSTQSVTVTASSSDANGPGDILYATGTIYRSGVGATCAPDNENCYQITSSSCSFFNSSSSVSCSANIWYVAQPTDTSTYSAQNWLGAIRVTGSGGGNTSSTATGVELNTLLAINITTSSINYGSVAANGSSGTQTTTVQNVGNCSSTLALYGTDLALVGQPAITIPVTAQQYSTSSFSWGAKPQLTSASTTVGGFLLTTPTTTAQSIQSTVYWAIGGFIAPTGTYNGTTTFVAVQSP